MSQDSYDLSTLQPFSEPPWVTGSPSPYYDSSHHALRKYLLDWIAKYLPDERVTSWEESGYRDEAIFEQAGRDGILLGFAFGSRMDPELVKLSGVKPPAGLDPAKWTPFHDFVLVDTLCTVGAGSAFMALHSGIAYGTGPILHFANEQMKRKVLPDVLNGKKKICLAITEPLAGSDVSNVGGTTAEKSADGKYYIVNGLKKVSVQRNTTVATNSHFNHSCKRTVDHKWNLRRLFHHSSTHIRQARRTQRSFLPLDPTYPRRHHQKDEHDGRTCNGHYPR